MPVPRFIDHLQVGDHASRPAANAVAVGTLYACTDHGIVYQSDGATWSNWFDGSSAAPSGAAGGSLGGTYPDPSIASDVALPGNPTTTTQTAGNNTTRIATTAFVQAAVTALIAAAPGALDTLDELAAALGDDASFAATITTVLAGKQPLDGDLTALAALARARGDLIVGGASDWIRLAKGTAGQRLRMVDADDPGWTDDDAGFPYIMYNGGAVLATGEQAGYIRAPFTGLITGWSLYGAPSGSIVVDSWKDIHANFPPTIADTIWSGTEPELSGTTNATATGLSIAVTKGDVIRHSIISVATLTEATLNYHMVKG